MALFCWSRTDIFCITFSYVHQFRNSALKSKNQKERFPLILELNDFYDFPLSNTMIRFAQQLTFIFQQKIPSMFECPNFYVRLITTKLRLWDSIVFVSGFCRLKHRQRILKNLATYGIYHCLYFIVVKSPVFCIHQCFQCEVKLATYFTLPFESKNSKYLNI